MNFILYFLFLLAACAAYYTYTWQMQTAAGFQVQEAAWTARLGKLNEAHQTLKDEDTEERNEIARTTTDLAEARRESALAALTPPPTAAPPPPVNTNTNALGSITTILGQNYADCHLLKVEAADIVVSTSEGILQIPFANMPPDLQKRFGFDPHAGNQLTDDQVRYQEQVRQANGP